MISCPQCPRTFSNDQQVDTHQVPPHSLEDVPPIENEPLAMNANVLEEIPDEAHREFTNNWHRIRGFHQRRRVEDVINFRVSDLSEIDNISLKIFRSQS